MTEDGSAGGFCHRVIQSFQQKAKRLSKQGLSDHPAVSVRGRGLRIRGKYRTRGAAGLDLYAGGIAEPTGEYVYHGIYRQQPDETDWSKDGDPTGI